LKRKKKDNCALYLAGERKEGRKKKRLSATIRPPYVIMCYTMWKRTRWCIQIDDRRSCLAVGWHHTRCLNRTDITHSLTHAKQMLAAFLIKKIKKVNVRISKRLYDPSNYPKTHVKVQKYPKCKTYFLFF